jgi:protein arginine N-methyltransferase 3
MCYGSDSPDSEDDSDWKEFDTEDDKTEYSACLFCPQVYGTICEVVSHCCIDHSFDLVKLKVRFNMDCYSYIKLVNYIRTHRPNASVLMSATEPVWEKEEYMKPVKPDDPWLMYGKLRNCFMYVEQMNAISILMFTLFLKNIDCGCLRIGF